MGLWMFMPRKINVFDGVGWSGVGQQYRPSTYVADATLPASRRTSNYIRARLMLRGPAAKKSFPTLWVPGTKMSCCMPRCGNGDSLTSTRSRLTKLHKCCE